MAFDVFYWAFNTGANEYAPDDQVNHTVTVQVNGTDVTGLTPAKVGNGQYKVSPSDAQLPKGARFALRGESSTEDVILVAMDSGVRPEDMRGTDNAFTDPQSRIDASISSRSSHSASDVLNETIAEPGSVPSWPAALKDALGWLLALSRNKRTTTSSADMVRDDADSSDLGSATLADDGSEFTRGKYS